MEKKKVAVFLANGFEEIEAVTPIDLLQRAGITVDTVSITKDNLVESARRMKILADKIIDEIDFSEYDMLILPGGPGVGNYFNSQTLLDNVLKFSKDNENKKIAAICAAPTVLSSLGILEGKNAVCFPACENELVKGKAVLGKDRAVTDGNVITSRSAGTALDFAFEIISELLGKKEAEKIADEIVYK
ncbi:DJ-1 family protein [Leptotrichia hofstadii]|jgi:DJ-1 family protein|uniref:DJ-1 family protein n=2 Tax=Leptotrichia hofstadii TaxID=157688 RepID=C9MV24_9FUSO|nr:DJ-1 family glyoxalase III [Leptotrichia hofstadii]EEX75794.1 DJ-1 family protein [Leptotrichia hofstadii F0254]BBM38896.1 DJ-1 family protein [Leptotrichia hofstadii]